MLLGAGASTAATGGKLPVMKNFFDHPMIKHRKRGYAELVSFLASFSGEKKNITSVNMEEVITHIDLSLNTQSTQWMSSVETDKQDLVKVREQFFRFLYERLRVPTMYRNGAGLLRNLFLALNQDEDSILTLNYDLLGDLAVLDLSTTYKKDPKDPLSQSLHERSENLLSIKGLSLGETTTVSKWQYKKGLYLKLHGSLNWFTCSNPACFNHSITDVKRIAGKQLGTIPWDISPIGEPCYRCGASFIPVIVPPTMQKDMQSFPKIGLLWHLAFRKLSDADKIVLVGTSLPESDYYLQWLLRETSRHGRPKKIFIINQNESASKRIKSIFGRDPVRQKDHLFYFTKSIEEYLQNSLIEI